MALLQIFKPGQGTWTRGLSALGIALLVAFGIHFVNEELRGATWASEYVRAGVAVAIALGFFALAWWLLNKPRIVDFMIATETEMRKVNWPTKKEIRGSTMVVIVGTLLVTLVLFIVDFGFSRLFTWIKIIDVDV